MRTLLVEDDADQRERVATWLRAWGLDVTAVPDANSGLLAHLKTPFEVLVVDWVMPGMDGLQLCRRVRGMPNGDRCYVLVVTGRDRPVDLDEVLEAGADDYIAKPLEKELLSTRVRIAQRHVERDRRHRKAQEALAQSEADFRRVIERSPLGVLAHDDGEIIYANESALLTLGRGRDEIVGTRLAEHVSAEHRELLERRAQRFERTQVAPPPMDVDLRRPDGRRAVARMIPATGAMVGGRRASFTLLEDITDRQRAERELRMTQFAVDHAADAAFWIGPDGRITYANAAACSMVGYAGVDLKGRRFLDFDTQRDAGQWPEVLREFENEERAHWEAVFRRRDQSELPVELMANVAEFDGKRIVIAFARDVTERRRLQASLQQADRLASVGSLAAGVAHEINNPLAYVIANLELLSEELRSGGQERTGPDLGKTLHDALDGAHRVRRIVGDLKSFARGGDDAQQAVDVSETLDVAIDIANNEIRHRARLVREYEAVPSVRGNSGRLAQVFVNLLVNAAHAIPEDDDVDHTVTVRTRPAGDDVVVEVSDTGVGIDPKVVGRIFDPFFTTKPQGMGTGLGLSICHGIVTALGGEISVESHIGRGTTMRVRFPVARPEAAPRIRTRWVSSAAAAARVLRILVVDDEPLIGQGIKRALSAHQVEVVGTGSEAIARCADQEFDVVLCDVMMPDVSGIEVYDRIREVRPSVAGRFVFMTGGAFTPRAREFLESVDNEQLTKPFSLKELRSLVAKRAESA